MSTFAVQHYCLLCSRVRTAMGFPVNVKFFLADTMCSALPRKSWVVVAFLTGSMDVLGGMCRYVSANMCKNTHLLERLKMLFRTGQHHHMLPSLILPCMLQSSFRLQIACIYEHAQRRDFTKGLIICAPRGTSSMSGLLLTF